VGHKIIRGQHNRQTRLRA